MKLTALIALLGLSATVTRFNGFQITGVSAEAVQSPLRARFNKDVLTNLVHKRDQEILGVFKDKDISNDASGFPLLRASIVPKAGIEHDDFDFDLHISKEYLGFESDKLQYKGSGVFDGKAFEFSGPIVLMKLRLELGN